jgi:hypothetical protein
MIAIRQYFKHTALESPIILHVLDQVVTIVSWALLRNSLLERFLSLVSDPVWHEVNKKPHYIRTTMSQAYFFLFESTFIYKLYRYIQQMV